MPDSSRAQLDWDAHGQPISRQFGDVYFSRASGLEETRHVFLRHNRIAERCAALAADDRLVIGETGFGTGLNFLCTWQAFAGHAPTGARLHFISVEKYPLSPEDLHRALALWPELETFSTPLLQQYQGIQPGFQRLLFDGGRVVLTLLVGDVLDCLPQLDARVDAWFLDGFAPAKNPGMWTPELFAQLARLSAPGATLATFTSAGLVRRGLSEAGFQMEKVKGYGHKREMLAGRYAGHATPAGAPWFAPPPRPRERRALIIGAGLAGCASAASLAARGWQVTLLERHGQVAEEGSGNPQGVLYLKLSAHGTPLSRLLLAGFGYTRRLLERLEQGTEWAPCGVLQLAFDDQEAERQAQLAAAFPPSLLRPVAREEAEQLAGVALASGGLFYPESGWAHPPALCHLLADHPRIRLLTHREALEIRREGGEWQVLGSDGPLAAAPVLVLANAADARTFAPTRELPLKRIRGQITRVPATAASQALRTVLCGEGYVAPPRKGEHTVGASFDLHNRFEGVTIEEHIGNLERLRALSADLAERVDADRLDPAALQGRAAYRCTSPDYLPLVGPLADAGAFAETYAVLARDARQVPETPCPWLEGLYLNLAHGSRGVVTAPLCGELLAAWLEHEPLPVPDAVAAACHPNRFLIRQLVRGRSG